MVYLIMEKFGPFRGLYCCVKEELFDGIIVAEVFLVFGIAAAVQVFMYSRYIEGASHFNIFNARFSDPGEVNVIKKIHWQQL